MRRLPPRRTRTDTLVSYTTLFLSGAKARRGGWAGLVRGAVIFAAGAACCAAAPTMPSLLAGRFGQGVGAGLLAALSYTFVRMVFPESLWPRIFAMIAAVWGVAALAGPALGGVLTQTVGWRAAFLSMVVPAFVLVVLAWTVFPREDRKSTRLNSSH